MRMSLTLALRPYLTEDPRNPDCSSGRGGNHHTTGCDRRTGQLRRSLAIRLSALAPNIHPLLAHISVSMLLQHCGNCHLNSSLLINQAFSIYSCTKQPHSAAEILVGFDIPTAHPAGAVANTLTLVLQAWLPQGPAYQRYFQHVKSITITSNPGIVSSALLL